jgi:HD-GYP domain-containing protein (c-di-GMP phosphodiesterase class II)
MISGYIIIPVLAAGMSWIILDLIKKQKDGNEAFMSLMISLSSLVEMKDRYTEGHSRKVRNWVSVIGKKMGLDKREVRDIIIAATLHDIGKVGIPDSILNKPDKLSDIEFEKIKEHPLLGLDSIRHIKRLRNLVGIIKHHHEAYNGSGYPDKLKGEDIPLGSRVIAVVDSFDAMTSDRAYREASQTEKAVSILIDEKGRQFDPEVVDIFVELLQKGEIKEEQDIVCGMLVAKNNISFQKVYQGKVYFFCSETCMEEFKRNPLKYVENK